MEVIDYVHGDGGGSRRAGALGEVLCAAYPSPRKHDCLNRPGMKVVHTARSPGARAPPEAPSLATQCTSVRFEKTYRASQRTNLLNTGQSFGSGVALLNPKKGLTSN